MLSHSEDGSTNSDLLVFRIGLRNAEILGLCRRLSKRRGDSGGMHRVGERESAVCVVGCSQSL